tara:strand:+ start:124 stop:510 length:387 start_codon:yes stop_codon:yes gene_type:complete
MKKILITLSLLFILSCSSDNDSDSVSLNTYEQALAGSWTGNFCELDDATSCSTQTLVLGLDLTGSVSNSWTSGEQWTSDLEWSATSSTISVTTLIDNTTDTAAYELNSDGNSLTINNSEGMVIVYNRM